MASRLFRRWVPLMTADAAFGDGLTPVPDRTEKEREVEQLRAKAADARTRATVRCESSNQKVVAHARSMSRAASMVLRPELSGRPAAHPQCHAFPPSE